MRIIKYNENCDIITLFSIKQCENFNISSIELDDNLKNNLEIYRDGKLLYTYDKVNHYKKIQKIFLNDEISMFKEESYDNLKNSINISEFLKFLGYNNIDSIIGNREMIFKNHDWLL